MMDVDAELLEAAQENLGAESREDAVEMALFLAIVIENPAEVLEIHGCIEEVTD